MNIPQYITQLTKEWIKSVSKRLIQGSFIRIDETEDTRTVSVDVESLKDFIEAGSGTVVSVDGHEPDANGAVSFGLTGSLWMKTDTNGHISTTTETPATVPSTSGYVKSDGSALSTVRTISVSDIDFGGYTNITSDNIGSFAVTDVTNLQIKVDTNTTNIGNKADKSDTYTKGQVNDILSNYLTDSDLNGYLKTSDVTRDANDCLTNTSLQHAHWASNVLVSVSGANVISVGSYFTAENKIKATEIKVKSNGGLTADDSGLALTALTPSKWMKTNSSGYPTTTNDTPVALDENSTGVLYANAGTLTYDGNFYDSEGNKKYVDLSSAQTISGSKTFYTQSVFFAGGLNTGGAIKFNSSDGTYNEIISGSDYTEGSYISLCKWSSSRKGKFTIAARLNASTLYALTGYGENGKLEWGGVTVHSTDTNDNQLPKLGYLNQYFLRKPSLGNNLWMKTDGSGNIGTTNEKPALLNSSSSGLVYNNYGTTAYRTVGLGLETSGSSLAVKCADGGGLTVDSSGLSLDSDSVVMYDPDNPPNAPSIVSLGSDGVLDVECALPTINDTVDEDKVLTCKKGGVALSWETSSGNAANPGSSVVNMDMSASASTTEFKSTWTAQNQGNNGLKLSVLTRVIWTGTELDQFYRTLTFDKNGKLYSVSKESKTTIDTPTQIIWA